MNVQVATAIDMAGNASSEGSSSSLARADHKHLIQGVERRFGTDPASGHFTGRLYYDTQNLRLKVCYDAVTPRYAVIAHWDYAAGVMLYSTAGVGEFGVTAAPIDGSILRSVADVPTWMQVRRVRVTHSVDQAIANLTDTVLAFNSERFDAGAFHDNATNNSRLTVPVDQGGIYAIGGSVEFNTDAGGDGFRELAIRLNGLTVIDVIRTTPVLAMRNSLSLTTLYELAAADYVEMVVHHSAGNVLNLNKAANYSPEFWMTRVA